MWRKCEHASTLIHLVLANQADSLCHLSPSGRIGIVIDWGQIYEFLIGVAGIGARIPVYDAVEGKDARLQMSNRST